MTEQEKSDQEQLEYLKQWQEKNRGRVRRRMFSEVFCKGGKEDGSERQNTKGH